MTALSRAVAATALLTVFATSTVVATPAHAANVTAGAVSEQKALDNKYMSIEWADTSNPAYGVNELDIRQIVPGDNNSANFKVKNQSSNNAHVKVEVFDAKRTGDPAGAAFWKDVTMNSISLDQYVANGKTTVYEGKTVDAGQTINLPFRVYYNVDSSGNMTSSVGFNFKVRVTMKALAQKDDQKDQDDLDDDRSNTGDDDKKDNSSDDQKRDTSKGDTNTKDRKKSQDDTTTDKKRDTDSLRKTGADVAWIAGIAAGLLAIGGFFVFLTKKRRKKDDEQLSETGVSSSDETGSSDAENTQKLIKRM